MSSARSGPSLSFWIILLIVLVGAVVYYNRAMDQANDTEELDRAIERAR